MAKRVCLYEGEELTSEEIQKFSDWLAKMIHFKEDELSYHFYPETEERLTEEVAALKRVKRMLDQ